MKLRQILFIAGVLGAAALPVQRSHAESPVQPVVSLHASLIDAMKAGGTQSYADRFTTLSPVVGEAHHFELIARVVLGAHWSGLEETQRGQFVQKLRELAVSNYAKEFDAYKGEAFSDVQTRELKRGQQLVRAKLERPSKAAVRFEYVVAQNGGEWGIINVIVDGVSDLAVKRAEYQQVLDGEGFEALMTRMEAQIIERGGRGV
ncbi:MAG: ABC transporter substrate-binding protein [Opitutales bacterium]